MAAMKVLNKVYSKVICQCHYCFHKAESSSFDVPLVINYGKLLVIGIQGPKHEPFLSHFISVQFQAAQINLNSGFNFFASLFLNSPPGEVSEYI